MQPSPQAFPVRQILQQVDWLLVGRGSNNGTLVGVLLGAKVLTGTFVTSGVFVGIEIVVDSSVAVLVSVGVAVLVGSSTGINVFVGVGVGSTFRFVHIDNSPHTTISNPTIARSPQNSLRFTLFLLLSRPIDHQ